MSDQLPFSLYQRVESENSADNYKTLKRSIEAIMITLEMLKFFRDHLATNEMCTNEVKKLLFIIICVLDQ